MLSKELYNNIKGYSEELCSIYDESALAIELNVKSQILNALQAKFKALFFLEEKVSPEGKIIIRAFQRK